MTDSQAAEPEDSEGSDAEPIAPEEHQSRSAMGLGSLVLLALVLGVIATSVSGFLWWQYRQFYVSLDQADADSRRALEDVRARIRRLEDSLAAAESESATARGALDAVEAELELVPPRLAALDQRLDAVQGGSFDARSQWLRAEAEYYLATANSELDIAGNRDNAITALELADSLLVELGDPALSAVREAIAVELIALKSVRVPDIEGLAFNLAGLAERVEELPMRADAPSAFASDEAALDAAEPGFPRLWLGMKQAVSGIIRVQRREEPVRPALSEAERKLVRRQLALELELARVAVVRAEQAGFTASLTAASGILTREFDVAAPTVEAALRLLGEMRDIEVAPELPNVSLSLNRLRAAGVGEN